MRKTPRHKSCQQSAFDTEVSRLHYNATGNCTDLALDLVSRWLLQAEHGFSMSAATPIPWDYHSPTPLRDDAPHRSSSRSGPPPRDLERSQMRWRKALLRRIPRSSTASTTAENRPCEARSSQSAPARSTGTQTASA